MSAYDRGRVCICTYDIQFLSVFCTIRLVVYMPSL